VAAIAVEELLASGNRPARRRPASVARRQKERDAARQPDQQRSQLVGPRRVQVADERHGADLHGYERGRAQYHSTSQVAAGAGEFRRHVRFKFAFPHEGVTVAEPGSGLREERLRRVGVGVVTDAFSVARGPVVDAAAGPEDVDGVTQAAAIGGAGEFMWVEIPAPGEPRGAMPTEVNASLSDDGI
ncbi:hypothetical protein EJB05_20951, partial [Eragrostis curvula]